MYRGDLEPFTAADVLAANRVIAPHHVGLRLGKASGVALVGVAGQQRFFAPDQPCDGVFVSLPAVGACEGVGALLWPLVEKVAFLHAVPSSRISLVRPYTAAAHVCNRLGA